MLSVDQREAFDRAGVIRLAGAVPAAEATKMCDRVWDFLAREQAVSRQDPASWPTEKPPGFQRLTRADAFSAMASDAVLDACTELLDDTRTAASHWGRPLVTFPQSGSAWTVPTAGWHIDGGLGPQPGITVFCFLDTVRQQGGGTVVLVGSPRLVRRLMNGGIPSEGSGQPLSSRVIKAKLGAASPWLLGLWNAEARGGDHQRYLDGGAVVDGVPVRVLELTGDPGDIVIMSTHMLHAVAMNTQQRVRMMLVQTLL